MEEPGNELNDDKIEVDEATEEEDMNCEGTLTKINHEVRVFYSIKLHQRKQL